MKRFLITVEVAIHDPDAVARYGAAAAEAQGFTPAEWQAYREKRGGTCADLMEWIPQCPAGATVERIECGSVDVAQHTGADHALIVTRGSIKGAA